LRQLIVEAALIENQIKIEINHEIPPETFIPKKIRLLDFNDNRHEESIDSGFILGLTPAIRKKVFGKMAVQITGHDKQRNPRESNVAWVIELEAKNSDPLRRQMRRIYNDPFELIAVLREIIESGDEEELRLFLSKFDIPLDLVLPPRNYQGRGAIQSRGNIEGEISIRHPFIFSARIMDAYADCLDRLFRKLERHAENPQVNKINNFIMIISSLYSLIWFIANEAVFAKYGKSQVIAPNDWALIRDYYDMLLRYINQSWGLVWSKGGYRDAIDAKITKDKSADQDQDPISFEQYLSEEHKYTVDELMSIALCTLETFQNLKETFWLRTDLGAKIKPVVFAKHHNYLQPQQLQKTKGSINVIRDNLIRLSNNSISLQPKG